MKALNDYCTDIQEFPPGHYLLGTGKSKDFVRWYKPEWAEKMPKKALSLPDLRRELEKSVKGQMMSDVPYGVLISGGLDSSLIAAIASKYRKKRVESGDQEEAWWPRLHSFAVGLEDSPDLKYARKVADYIGTVHHEIIFTIQEAFDAIRDVIYHLETFDVTTIRAATPMYLMARKIKSMGIKMVLSGEGADEVFGGYLYFQSPQRQRILRRNRAKTLHA
jgi:asparagine synthase (glutamine-hydrolysing)